MSRICLSISFGWSPTGTFVRPGKSTKVRVRTLGEKIRRLIGTGEIPAWHVSTRSLSTERNGPTSVLSSFGLGIPYNLSWYCCEPIVTNVETFVPRILLKS
jgi:hypothetical protein